MNPLRYKKYLRIFFFDFDIYRSICHLCRLGKLMIFIGGASPTRTNTNPHKSLLFTNTNTNKCQMVNVCATNTCGTHSVHSTNDINCIRVMILTPVCGRITTICTVSIHAIDFILCLFFSQVRVMNPHLMVVL